MSLILHERGGCIRRGRFARDDGSLFNSHFRFDEYSVHNIEPPQRLVDVGACIGDFGFYAMATWPGCEVISIEPYTPHLECLRANAGGQRVVHAAVWYGNPNDRKLYRPHPHNSQSITTLCPVSQEHDVVQDEFDATTLEEELDAAGWDTADLLKLDCEGGEIGIFQHADIDRFRMIVGEHHMTRRKFSLLVKPHIERGWKLEFTKLHHVDCGIFHMTHQG